MTLWEAVWPSVGRVTSGVRVLSSLCKAGADARGPSQGSGRVPWEQTGTQHRATVGHPGNTLHGVVCAGLSLTAQTVEPDIGFKVGAAPPPALRLDKSLTQTLASISSSDRGDNNTLTAEGCWET